MTSIEKLYEVGEWDGVDEAVRRCVLSAASFINVLNQSDMKNMNEGSIEIYKFVVAELMVSVDMLNMLLFGYPDKDMQERIDSNIEREFGRIQYEGYVEGE